MIEGSPVAFKAYFLQAYPGFYSFAHLLLREPVSAANVVAEAFFLLWKKKEDFHDEKNSKAFLYTVIRNNSLHFLQYRQKHPEHQVYTYDAAIAASLPQDVLRDLSAFIDRFVSRA